MLNESAREQDHNGYLTIRDNPISRAGVFQYKGSQLPDADPNKMYNVYRPLEELQDPETLKSFQGLPIVDDHEMLGDRYARGAEERGVHGSILETVRVAGLDVLANIRIFSRTLKSLLDAGKTGLSLGYNCTFKKISGVFEGIAYDYIQTNIRGNHLALVNQGRSGTVVLDQHQALDHFDLALDTQELNMADEDKKDDKEKKTDTAKDGEGEKEMSLSEVTSLMKKLVPQIEALTAAMKTEADPETAALDGDEKEKSGDQAKDEKDDKKDDKAMDAAEIGALVDSRVNAATKTIMKNAMGQASKRDALVKDLTPHTGTFDASAMDEADVAVYANEKLSLGAPKGQELGAVKGFIAGMAKAGDKKIGFAMDSANLAKPKSGGLLATRLSTQH